MQKTFVLSVDGGGAKSLISIYILKEIEKLLGKDLPSFELYAGTSAGSIIASSLAIGRSVDDIVAKFEDLSPKIFPTGKKWKGKSLFCSRYDSTPLKSYLNQEFNTITMQDVFKKHQKKLIIPIVQLQKVCSSIIKTPHDDRFTRDQNIRLADAIISSSSAPMYFDPHYFRIQGSGSEHTSWLTADGSLFMTNPSLVAVLELIKYNNITDIKSNYENIGDIFLLSIGNIRYSPEYNRNPFFRWGFLTGWGHEKLVESMMELQKRSAHEMTKLLLPKENYIRLEYHGENIDLDCDINLYKDKFKIWAEQIVKGYKDELINFFNKDGNK